MIKIIAKLKVKEGCKDQLMEATKELIEKSRAEEGNVYYTLNQSTEDANTLAFIECWKDQAAVETHNASAHFQGAMPKVAPLCEGDMKAEIFVEL